MNQIVEHAKKRRVRNISTASLRLFMAPHPGKNIRQNFRMDNAKMWHQFSRSFLNPRLLVRSAGKSVLCGTKPWRSFLWMLRAQLRLLNREMLNRIFIQRITDSPHSVTTHLTSRISESQVKASD